MDSEILIVAADPADRRDLAERLKSAGYASSFADSALTQLRQRVRPRGVIVHDAARGKADPVLALVRSRHPGLCVIVITGVIDEAEYARLLSLGATACVSVEDASMMLIPLLESNLTSGAAPVLAAGGPVAAPARPAARTGSVNVKVATWQQYALLHTSDLSKGGLFIRMQDPAPVSTALLVRLGLPSGETLELPATVVHVLDPDVAAEAGKHPGVGVSFTEWNDSLRQRFADLQQEARQGAATGAGPRPALPPAPVRPPVPAAPRLPVAAAARPVPAAAPPARPPAAAAPPARPPLPGAPRPPALPAKPGPPVLPTAKATPVVDVTAPARPVAAAAAARPPAPTAAAIASGVPVGMTGASLATALREHLDDLKRMDYFAVLGVTGDSEPAAIRKSFLALAKEWHPGRFALEPDGVRELVAEIFIMLKTAHDSVADDEKRALYKAKLARRAAQPSASVASQLPAAPWVYTPPPAPNSVVQQRPVPNSVVQQRPSSVVRPNAVVQPRQDSVVRPNAVVLPRPLPGSVAQRAPEPPRAPPPLPPRRPPAAPAQQTLEDSLSLDSLSLDALAPMPESFAPSLPLQGLDIGMDIDVPIEVEDSVVGPAPPKPVNQDLARADHFIKGGFFRAAQQALERALGTDPHNPILRGRLAVAGACEAQRKGDFDGAAKLFRAAVDANPTDELAVEGLRALNETTKKDDRRGLLKRLLSR